MKKIRVLIADDVPSDYEALREKIDNYFQQVKKISQENYEITIRDTIDSTIKNIQDEEPYDIFFADINFSESSAEKRNGYLLIREAYKKCPLTYICVYSGVADTVYEHHEEYINLLKRGMLSDIYEKEFFMGKDNTRFFEQFKTTYNFVISNAFIWELWANHKIMIEKLNTSELSTNISSDNDRKDEIKSNLDTITLLLQRKTQFNADVILFRLVLQLYHRSLEIFVTGDKSEEKIVEESDKARSIAFSFVKDLFKKKDEREIKDRKLFPDKKSFLRKIAAFSPTKIYRYGHILNWYRNGSVHPKPNIEFIPKLLNVLFANLTFAAYVLDGDFKSIKYDEFKKIANSEGNNPIAQKDFQSLLGFMGER